MVHGDDDPIPWETASTLADGIGASFHLIPDCGHVPYVEAPDAFFSALDPVPSPCLTRASTSRWTRTRTRAFETIRDALAADGVDPYDRDAFLMHRAVVELIHGGRPAEGLGDAIDEFTAYTHLVFLFWLEGQQTVEVGSAALDVDLLGGESPTAEPPTAPNRLLHGARAHGSGAPRPTLGPEPLDGWFAARRGDRLMVAAIFGGRPEREDISVVAVDGPEPAGLQRSDGTPLFASDPSGGSQGRALFPERNGGTSGARVAGGAVAGGTGLMDRTGVVRVLDQIASLLELKGENPFRVRAFRTAARTIASGTGDLAAALDDGSLAAARGVGPAILQIVTDLVRTDRSRVFEELRDQVPPVLLEMLAISGLGVAKARLIHEQLGVDTLTELEDAARDGRLARLPGFGPRSAENVLRGLAYLRRQSCDVAGAPRRARSRGGPRRAVATQGCVARDRRR